MPKCQTADPGKCLGEASTVVQVRETDTCAMIDVPVCEPCGKLIESFNSGEMFAFGCFAEDDD